MSFRVKPMLRRFSTGEVAPAIDGLMEIPEYAQGCLTLENFIVQRLGAVTRRPGSVYVQGAISNSAASRLIPFTVADGTGYVLEFGNESVRVFKQSSHAQVLASLATPYATADLFELKCLGVGDELYVTHRDYEFRKIVCHGDADWEIVEVPARKDVVFFGGGASNTGYISYDACGTWNTVTLPAIDGAWTASGFVQKEGRYIICGINAGGDLVGCWSTDLRVFHGFDAGSGTMLTAHVAAGRGLVVAGGARQAAYSSDGGESWTYTGASALGGVCEVLLYGDRARLFVAFGDAGTVDTSEDGATWTARTAISTSPHHGIYANGMYVVAGAAGDIAYSTTGITFTEVVVDAMVVLYRVAYGNGYWMVAGHDGAATYVAFSNDDCATWFSSDTVTDVGNPKGSWYYDGAFYVVGAAGGVQKTTDYGLTWTSVGDIGAGLTGAWMGAKEALIGDNSPHAIAYHERRTIVGASTSKPDTVMGSKTGTMDDFTQQYLANFAWEYQLAARQTAAINWLESAGGAVVVGARNAIGLLAGSPEVGITPSTVQFRWINEHGAADVQGVAIGERVVYVSRGKRAVRSAPDGRDLTLLADHIADDGITQIAGQQEPFAVLWFVRSDGQLLSLTLEGGMTAWARHIVGGSFGSGDAVVESVAVVPNAATCEDELWLAVKRTINGSTVRYIEYLKPLAFGAKEDAFFVASGVTKTGSDFTAFDGLSHLEGEEVAVLIDGNIVERHTVSSGEITLTAPADKAQAGLPYTSKLQTTRMSTPSPWGTAVGLLKRIHKLFVFVYETIGGKYGSDETVTESVPYTGASELETDVKVIPFPGQSDRDGYMWAIQEDPLPMTVLAVSPDLHVGDT